MAEFGAIAAWSVHAPFAFAAMTAVAALPFVEITLPSSPPVTIASRLAAEQRIAPPWTVTRRSSPLSEAKTSASSPSTKTAVPPRKCAPTTGASTLTGRVRSTTEGMSEWVSVIVRSRYSHPARLARQEQDAQSRFAAFKAPLDLVHRHVAADEHEAAQAFFVLLPVALVVAVEDHVHALEHEALVVVLEREDALAAQDVRPFLLDQVLDPRKELLGVERLVGRERDRLHILVVIVLE